MFHSFLYVYQRGTTVQNRFGSGFSSAMGNMISTIRLRQLVQQLGIQVIAETKGVKRTGQLSRCLLPYGEG